MALKWLLSSSFTRVLGSSAGLAASASGGQAAAGSCCMNSIQEEGGKLQTETARKISSAGFQMPLHYPRYTKAEYEKMEEWKVDVLLREYGLSFDGTVDEKRAFAMGAFLWPDQL